MTHLDLEIDENDPDLQDVWGRYSDMKAFHVLRHYLDGTEGFSILQTIKSLHDMLPDRTEDGTETQHSNFSHTVLDIAQQIPYSHPAQEHLARLLHELRRSTKLTDRVIDEEDNWTFYINLDQFFATTRERCAPAGFEAFTPEEEHVINTSAFLAHLCSYGMLSRPLWAIWTLRLYLEEPSSDDCYSGRVMTAAVWIVYAGQWLFTQMVQCPRAMDSWDERACSAGSLYTGSVLGLTRWTYWKEALKTASESEKAHEEARRLTRKAVAFMDAIEELYQGL